MIYSPSLQKDIEFADRCFEHLTNPSWTVTVSEPDEHGTTKTICTAVADGREYSVGYITTRNVDQGDDREPKMRHALNNSMAQLLALSPEDRDKYYQKMEFKNVPTS